MRKSATFPEFFFFAVVSINAFYKLDEMVPGNKYMKMGLLHD